MTKTVGARLIVREVYSSPTTGSGGSATITKRTVFDKSWSYQSVAGVVSGDVINVTEDPVSIWIPPYDADRRQLFVIAHDYASSAGALLWVSSTTRGPQNDKVVTKYLWITTETIGALVTGANQHRLMSMPAGFTGMGVYHYVEGELEDDLNILPGGSSVVDPLVP